jgi:hypothetical protein
LRNFSIALVCAYFEKYKTQTADLSAVFFIALIIIVITATTVATAPRLIAVAVARRRRCRSRSLSGSVKLSATGYAHVAVAVVDRTVRVSRRGVIIARRTVIAATAMTAVMTATALIPRVAAVIPYLQITAAITANRLRSSAKKRIQPVTSATAKIAARTTRNHIIHIAHSVSNPLVYLRTNLILYYMQTR